jgi:transposase
MTAPAGRDARARKFARLWATGMSVRQVAKRCGVHHQTVLDDLRWLDRWPYDGLKPYRRRRVPARDKRADRAAELRAEGLSLRQIAERLSCSHQTISNDLARWDAEHPPIAANVIPLLRKASRSGG